jgi:L-fucose isomerase-like protein
VIKLKNKFGVIVSTRSFFPSHLVKTAREQIAEVLEELGYGYVMVGEQETEYGAVVSFDEAKICAELFKKNREDMRNYCGFANLRGTRNCGGDSARGT